MKSEQLEVRDATDADFIRLYGIDPPTDWRGFAAVRGRLVVGVAGAFKDDAGKVWGFLDVAPSVRSPARFHRRALRFLRSLEADEIRVTCDERIAKAAIWLSRLGFKETGEECNGNKVWVCQGLKPSL